VTPAAPGEPDSSLATGHEYDPQDRLRYQTARARQAAGHLPEAVQEYAAIYELNRDNDLGREVLHALGLLS
jgi:hypothetical protein